MRLERSNLFYSIIAVHYACGSLSGGGEVFRSITFSELLAFVGSVSGAGFCILKQTVAAEAAELDHPSRIQLAKGVSWCNLGVAMHYDARCGFLLRFYGFPVQDCRLGSP